ncbi:hypothetical protein [Rhizobium sp. CCGE532]|uniref:SDH family Clp fold serine proteinase n=1 Tax=Rhizobium sp. CCGE532 TaxID=2364272 RepID=UPI000EA8EE51|nr:hypothetical protein CCGE532_31545 [Rhizobium sp. CCGE532]
MTVATRKALLEKIEADRGSKALRYVTAAARRWKHRSRTTRSTILSNTSIRYGRHRKLHSYFTLMAAIQRLHAVSLTCFAFFALEVLVPNKAHSAGTLISLGANRIIMTKQATLGPIDPSLSGPLSPMVPGQPHQRVPVSVEAVQGFIDLAKSELGVVDGPSLGTILNKLSDQIHPLVLGQIFRSRNQIRELAKTLLENHGLNDEKRKQLQAFSTRSMDG